MESRKRPRRGTAPSRVAEPDIVGGLGKFAYISMLIDDGGRITLGAVHPVPCVAIASDRQGSLAMLRRRPDESIAQLLRRLDDSIALAMEADEMIDEINVGVPTRKP